LDRKGCIYRSGIQKPKFGYSLVIVGNGDGFRNGP
jgi:hypothetical protein